MSRRRAQVLDGALAVLGDDGTRALTYQATDLRAGVPAGTTSNYFRSRAVLLRDVLAHLLDLDRSDWERFTQRPVETVDQLAEILADLARQAIGPGRTRVRARYALFLEAMTHPELAGQLATGRAEILDLGARWLARLDLPDPGERYARLIAHLDGIVLHQLTFPTDPFDPAPGFRALLTIDTGTAGQS